MEDCHVFAGLNAFSGPEHHKSGLMLRRVALAGFLPQRAPAAPEHLSGILRTDTS